MWLYVPSACAPARPESNSACMLPESNAPLSATWNGKPMRRRTLPGLLTRAPYLMRLSGLTCEPSAMQTSALSWKASNLICSAADTPANPSPSPAGSVARMILDTYGPGLLKRLAHIGRKSAFSRTCQLTLNLGIPKCEPTFEEWVTELRKDCSRRASLARVIVGSGCSSSPLWNTPQVAAEAPNKGCNQKDKPGSLAMQASLTANRKIWRSPSNQEPGISLERMENPRIGHRNYDAETGRLAQTGLTQQAAMWSTPAAAEAVGRTQSARALTKGFQETLCGQAGMWPTADSNTSTYSNGKFGPNLRELAAMWPTASTCERGPESKDSKATRPDTGGIDLQTAAQQWATPAGADQTGTTGGGMGRSLRSDINQLSRQAPANSTDGQQSSPSGPTSRPPEVGLTNTTKVLRLPGSMFGSPDSMSHTESCGMSPLAAEIAVLKRWAARGGSSRFYRRSAEQARLNPAFVGWLMGFPYVWTHIEATGSDYMATQLSRWSPRMRGYFYGLICSMAREGGNG